MLVLKMNRTGLGGAGELIIAFSDGLVHPPGVCAQCRPRQRLGSGEEVICVANCRMVCITFVVMSARPASTNKMPSLPIEAVMLPPAPTSM